MIVERYGGTGVASNAYLVTDAGETAAILVDPSLSPAALRKERGRPLPPITAVLLTHVHFDHMLAVDAFRAEGIPLFVGAPDALALDDGEKNAYRLFYGVDRGTGPAERLLSEGDRISVGGEGLSVLMTPGHTPGSLCLYAPGILLAGDTLFAGSIGRNDLPGGDGAALMRSLKRLARLPDETTVYPGHGPVTSIAREKQYNPYLGELFV